MARISFVKKRLGFRVQNPVDIKCCHRNKIFQRSGGILFTFGEIVLGLGEIVFGSEGIVFGLGGIVLGLEGIVPGHGGIVLGSKGIVLSTGGIVSGFGEILLGHWRNWFWVQKIISRLTREVSELTKNH